jgi:hypothetical protein
MPKKLVFSTKSGCQGAKDCFDFYSRSHIGREMVVEFQGRCGRFAGGVQQEWRAFNVGSALHRVRVVAVEALQLHGG